ncbi:methyltransferase domain-containing protein [Flavobacterium sp.]|uniref:methyltransferase domain-containing protein n=1 Tax=Flavobacterium sp. TaxID=239 RepID=UPI0026284187|nr:methyltransferase domain-containing protein [Flavobacterium sp.]MDG2431981.1 methyltransferase domain-containing protein [Flavobacterium sp.]
MSDEKCCVVTCDLPLDKTYWDNQYQANATGWDLGEVSPPIKSYIDKIKNKEIAILIPGCGNTYEAEYLLQQGFTNITVIDIAPTLVENLKNKFENNKNISVVLGDFFEHQGSYDLIIEQTFFCALPPTMRQKYVWKMHQLLSNHGILAGLLFNRDFEVSPPFGGNAKEYEQLFHKSFVFNSIGVANNSIPTRANTELFIEFQKNDFSQVNLYHFEGITCSGCMKTVSSKFLEIEGVLNVSMNTNFSEILLVSKEEIALKTLQEIVSYDEKYKINKTK